MSRSRVAGTARIAVLLDRIRVEEKLLLKAFEARNVAVDVRDDREIIFDLRNAAPDAGLPEGQTDWTRYDVVFERCVTQSRAVAALRILNDWGVRTVNRVKVVQTCGDKLATTSALVRCGVPTPRVMVAFTPQSALEAIETMGYPAILKPAVGSWGRLLSKVNDREAAETILEHKQVLGSYQHHTYYVQEYVDKPARDIRSFVVGDETIGAIYRYHQHCPRWPGRQLPGDPRHSRTVAGSGARCGRWRGGSGPAGDSGRTDAGQRDQPHHGVSQQY